MIHDAPGRSQDWGPKRSTALRWRRRRPDHDTFVAGPQARCCRCHATCYKNHIYVDKATKLIAAYSATDASFHDSQVIDSLLRPANGEAAGGAALYADSAYRSEATEQALVERGHDSQIRERAWRNIPLTERQEVSNTEKSRVRTRVENGFGTMENSMGGIFLRSIGKARAAVGIGLMNLVYNLRRVETLIRHKVFDFDRVTTSALRTAT